ncbi:hypothetical protein BH10PLA1_BH10PLA1_02850 [soil metagenome]
MFMSTLVTPRNGRSGKILAATLALGGLLIALLAMRFRVFTPQTVDPASTQPHVMGDPEP